MRLVALALLAVVLCDGQARATDPITQDRDEPGRNPLQQTVYPSCNYDAVSCTCLFPPVPDHYRYVVTELNVLATIEGYDSVIAQLSGSNYSLPSAAGSTGSTPSLNISMPYIGEQSAGSVQYAFHGPTLAYFLWKDTPTIKVYTEQGAFVFYVACTIIGYTVTVP